MSFATKSEPNSTSSSKLIPQRRKTRRGTKIVTDADLLFDVGMLQEAAFGVVDIDEILWNQSPRRKMVARLVCSMQFKIFTAVCIMTSIALSIYEADRTAMSEEFASWFMPCLHVLSVIYFLEFVMLFYVSGPKYFTTVSNLFDFLLVVMDVAFGLIEIITGSGPQVQTLRLFRLLRVLRMIRLFIILRPLYMMLHGLLSVMQAIFWATIMLAAALAICAITAVNMLHPIVLELVEEGHDFSGCPRCARAFESVFIATLTFLETILPGETFNEFALTIIERAPWTLVIFVGAHIIVQLGITNLILAVIVDQARMARESDNQQVLLEKEQQKHAAKERLHNICISLDSDGSGSLTLSELLENAASCQEFVEVLKLMDIGREDLSVVFSILDQDKSGEVSYSEFVDELHNMKSKDSHTLLIFIRHYVLQIREQMNEQMETIKNMIGHDILAPLKKHVAQLKADRLTTVGENAEKSNTNSNANTDKHEHPVEDQSRARGSYHAGRLSGRLSEQHSQGFRQSAHLSQDYSIQKPSVTNSCTGSPWVNAKAADTQSTLCQNLSGKLVIDERPWEQHVHPSSASRATPYRESLQVLGDWMPLLCAWKLKHIEARQSHDAAEAVQSTQRLSLDTNLDVLGVAAVLEGAAEIMQEVAARISVTCSTTTSTRMPSPGFCLGGEPEGDQTSRPQLDSFAPSFQL